MNIFGKDNKHDSSIEESSTISEFGKSSLWSRIFRNEENQIYSDIIIKGFVWVVMFIVSLVALIIVFKDGYNSNEEVIVIAAKNNNVYTKNSDASSANDTDTFTFDDSSNKNLVANNNEARSNNIKQQNAETNIKNSAIVNNNRQQSDLTSKKDTNLPNISAAENTEPNQNTVDDLIRDTSNVSNKSSASVAINKPDTKAVTNNTVKANTNDEKVWLVTIYSGSTEALAKSKWLEIQKRNPNFFNNKKPYFIKTNIAGKGVFYRVSLGDAKANNELPLFATTKEASDYCNYLKNNKINCFISVVNKLSLSNLSN